MEIKSAHKCFVFLMLIQKGVDNMEKVIQG